MFRPADISGELPDDLPPEVVSQLVAYDENRANGDFSSKEPSFSSHDLEMSFACIDLMHRVWPHSLSVPSSAELGIPETLGDLHLIRELGRGGMGIVYEAEQRSMGRRVAVKILPQAALLSQKSLQRFHNEVRAVAALDHRHIMAVYAMGMEHGFHYFTMQLVRGRSLADIVADLAPKDNVLCKCEPEASSNGNGLNSKTSPLTKVGTTEFYHRAANIGLQACQALQHAHEVGVLHRDVKPSNLMLDDACHLYITDFGLARIVTDPALTMTGDIIGTLRYMAPEQALPKGAIVDHRADIYSLGATLYEVLTLQPAFFEADRAKLLSQIAFEEPKSLRKIDRRIPADLETIVLKAMSKQPAERYPTAESMAHDLQAFLAGRAIMARPATLADRVRSWSRRHTGVVRVASFGVILLSVLLGISTVMISRAQIRTGVALENTADLLYAADIALAYQAYEKRWPDEAQQILDRYIPTDPRVDRRGLEWHLLAANLQRPAIATLAGHQGAVNELAVFPDGHRFASVGNDGMLRIWDLVARTLIRAIPLDKAGLHSVAISPDGRYIAAGGNKLYLRDLNEDGQTREIFQAEHTIESLAFHPNGDRIALGIQYHEVCLLGLEGAVVKRVPCASRIESLEFSRDGSSLIFPDRIPTERATTLGIVHVWNADLSSIQKKLDCHSHTQNPNITIARQSPDGRFIVAGELYNCQAHLFDSSGRIVFTTPASRDRVTDVAYSPNGTSLLLGCTNGQVECFSIQLNDTVPALDHRSTVFTAHQTSVKCVRFVNDTRIITAGDDGLIKIIDLPIEGENIRRSTIDDFTGLMVSPDGTLLLCTTSNGWEMSNAISGQPKSSHHKISGQYSSPTWSRAGNKAAVLSAGVAHLLDSTGKRLRAIDCRGADKAAALSPDGSTIALIGFEQFQICDTSTSARLMRKVLPNQGLTTTFSPDGAMVAYGGNLGAIFLMDVADHQQQREFSCSLATTCMAFTPDALSLVTGHSDGTIRLWDVRTGKVRAELIGHEQTVLNLAISGDGRTLLSSGNDGAIRVWSIDRSRGFGEFYRFSRRRNNISTYLGMANDASVIAAAFTSDNDPGPNLYLWRLAKTGGDPGS